MRILVEQVIRRLKTFQIVSNEIPLSLLSHVNDILIVCSALCNFKEPLYNGYVTSATLVFVIK